MLELFSFTLDKETFSDRKVYYMQLPESWRAFTEKRYKERKKYKLKPTKLTDKLKTVFPMIFYTNWRARQPWLLADEVIDVKLIQQLGLRWLADEHNCSVQELSDELQRDTIVWQEATMKELLAKYGGDDWRFQWVPALMARVFAKEKKALTLINSREEQFTQLLDFYHVCFHNKHECMSEPVQREEAVGSFSYVIRFLYQTRGLLPEHGLLNVKVGMRRFLDKSIDRVTQEISYRNAGSILIGLKNIFYKQSNIQTLSQWKYRNDGKKISWTNYNGDEAFADLFIKNLHPQAILQDPLSYRKKTVDMKSFVVFNDLVFRSKYLNKVNHGIGLPERYALYQLVKDTFPELTTVAKLKKINQRRLKNKSETESSFYISPQTIGTMIICEVWQQAGSKLMTDLINQLIEDKIIEVDKETNSYILHSDREVAIKFVSYDATTLIQSLNIEKYGNDAYRYHERMIENKLFSLKKSENSISLIEIYPKKSYPTEKADPKKAIRTAFAKNNRLTQFIYPEKETGYTHRMKSSFLDMLADIGVVRMDTKQLIDNKIIFGFDMVTNGGRDFPVVYRLYEGELKVKLFGTDVWHSLPNALLYANKVRENDFFQLKNKSYDEIREIRERVKRFYERSLESIEDVTTEEILIIADVKLRKYWYSFANPALQLTELPKMKYPVIFKDKVKVIRFNQSIEVPQYTVHPKDGWKPNQRAGIFTDETGIFYSVGARPDNMKFPVNKALKYEQPESLFLDQRLLEIIVTGETDEVKRGEYAMLTNDLRRMNVTFEQHTSKPYPLHLTSAIKKYMTFIDEAYPKGEFDEEVIDTTTPQLQFNLE